VLHIAMRDDPVPAPDEVLVAVEAAALNRADLLQREGRYPPPAGVTDILGLEVAGVVSEVGSECRKWAPGDRVFGLLPGGGYATMARLHEDLALRIPDSLTSAEAAAIPEAFLTAYQALAWLGGIRNEHNVLIHAGGSGVGTAAIQIARYLGATVYVTASPRKHDVCRSLGATACIDYRSEDFDAVIQDSTNGRGANIIVDFVGAPYFEKNVSALAPDGRIVLLGLMGGSLLEKFQLSALFRKRGSVIASTLRSRSVAYKSRLTSAFEADLLPAFEDGDLGPVIDSVMDWNSVSEAHERMEANLNTGKIVLAITPA
jgi:putative PIG3 family NAD(P)H quinone oxidoreductase